MRALRALLSAAAVALALFGPGTASPITRSFTLTDRNAQALVNPANGVLVWRTDGERDNVFLLAHYLRRPGDDRERTLRTFFGNTPPTGMIGPDRATLSWRGSDLAADLDITLLGGEPGSGRSSLSRTLTLTNLGAEPLALVLFDYIDIDAVFSQFDPRDRTRLAGPDLVETINATRPELLFRTRLSPRPHSWQIDDWRVLYDKFIIDRDGPTTLASTPPIGAWFPSDDFGDQAAVFGWEISLEPGARFQLATVHERLIPEPSALAPLAVGLIGLVAALLRARNTLSSSRT